MKMNFDHLNAEAASALKTYLRNIEKSYKNIHFAIQTIFSQGALSTNLSFIADIFLGIFQNFQANHCSKYLFSCLRWLLPTDVGLHQMLSDLKNRL